MREKDIPQISYEMIQEITNPTYFNRGESYYKSSMVKKGWITEDGIKAKVIGNYKPYYLVEITVSDTMELTGRCTCQVGFGCKHSIAACLQYLYEPEFFIKIDSYKSSDLEADSSRKRKRINVRKEYELNSFSIQNWVSSLPLEILKKKFIELWNHFAPKLFKDLLDPDYPHKFWFSQLVDIMDFDDSYKKHMDNKKSERWFTPLELLNFLNDSDLFISILYNWTQSFIELGREIKQEFTTIGITEKEIDFDPEFYFSGEDYNKYENRSNYDYDYDYDPELIAKDFFSQFEKIFEEFGRFFGTLLNENLSDLANNLFDFGIKWYLELNLFEYRDYGLNELYKIQQKFDQKNQNIQATKLTGKERLDFLLQMYLNFKSEDLKESIINELHHLTNNHNLKEIVKEIWRIVFEKYKIEMAIEYFLFLLELSDTFSQDKVKTQNLIKNTILNIKKHSKYPYDFIDSIFNHYGMKSNENMEWLYLFIIKGEINGQKIVDNIYEKNSSFLCSFCFEWFLKYFLPKGSIIKIEELCKFVLKNNPSTFRFNHYSMIRNFSKNDSEFEKKIFQFLKIEFLPGLIRKHQYHVVVKIYLNQNDYSKAISLTISHFNTDRGWDVIKKIHTDLIVNESDQTLKSITKDDFLLLVNIFKNYTNESMKLRSKYRPDLNISQGVQLCLNLYKYFKIQSKGDQWLSRFCKKYKRFHNLRSSLKSLGIEMV